MALIALENSDIQFDPAFISAAEIEELRTSFTPETVMTGMDEAPAPFGLPLVTTYEEAREQVRHLMESEGLLADMLADVQQDSGQIDVDDILADMDAQLKPVLETGELPADVIRFAEDGVKFATFTETEAGSTLTLDNQEVLRIGPLGGSRDKNLKVTAATVVVVIDLIFIVMAISSVRAAQDRRTKEAMGEVVKKSINPMTVLAKELLRRLSGAIAAFRDKDKPKKTVVIDMINDIATAVMHAMKHMWKSMWGDVKRIVKAMLSSIKAILKAIASIAATVLLAIGTAGAALAASLLSLALALVSLVEDSIQLKNALGGA